MKKILVTLLGSAFFMSCSSVPTIETVGKVDIKRFMGTWYVIGNIPTFIEKGAHNAIESYQLKDDGTIATTFTFYKKAFDGPKKTYNPRGFIRDRKNNAVWDMQFFWPLKSEFLIIYLDSEYKHTVIGRSKRDYVWIMSRTPSIPEEEYKSILGLLKKAGYDVTKIQKVPQRWDE